MPEVMTNHLVFERSKRVFDILKVPFVNAGPINQVGSTLAAATANTEIRGLRFTQ